MADQSFTEGLRVEVRSEEEGFRDAWYEAIIFGSTHPDEFVVQYDRLLDDKDDSKLLIEWVHVSCIRPCPPSADDADCFKMYEVVDAFYRDGWWTGVVIRAVVGSSKILVHFENPLEEMEFDRSDLRRHYDWVDGKWERPPMKMGMILSKGTAVEISFTKRKCNVWHPGTVLQVTGKNNFLVEYQFLGASNKAEKRKVVVDSLQIRPSPPCLEDRNFMMLDKVEAYYDFCWWSGMINRVLEERVYDVVLEHENKEKIFNHLELRPHMDWTDGKWTISSWETYHFTMQNNQPLKRRRKKRGAKKRHVGIYCTTSIATGKEDSSAAITEEVEMSVNEVKDTLVGNPCETPGKEINQFAMQSNKPLNWNRKKRWAKKPQAGRHGAKTTAVDKEDNAAVVIEDDAENECTIEGGLSVKEVKDTLDVNPCETPDEACTNIMENPKQQIVDPGIQMVDEINGSTGKENNQKKRGRQRKTQRYKQIGSVGDIPLAESQTNKTVARKRLKGSHQSLSNEHDEMRIIVGSESQIEDCQHASRGKTSESREVDNEKNGDVIVIGGTLGDMADDQTLNMWLRDKTRKGSTDDTIVSPVGSLEQSAKSIGKDDESEIPSTFAINDVKSSALQKPITNEPGVMPSGKLNQSAKSNDEGEQETASAMAMSNSVDKNQNLPFVKSSPVWKVFETMDIFHKTAQKPHFSPLGNCAEDIREGLAIAQMVTFANLVEKASKLKLCDPRSMIESSLQTLDGLESHGFDVKAMRSCLTELLSKKNRECELQGEYMDIENQLRKHILEKNEYEKEINELNEEFSESILKMKRLKEKLTIATDKKETKEQEISTMRLKMAVVGENIGSLRLDYETLVASPW